MRKKRKELRHHARKKKLHCVLLFNLGMNPDPNFFYLTGYPGYGCLVLLKDKEYLLVPQMEILRARKLAKGLKVIMYQKNFWQILKKYLKGKSIGIDYSTMTLSFMKAVRKQLKKKRFIDVSPLLREIRSVKTDEDIKKIRKACSISDDILKRCVAGFSRFKTEKQAAEFLESETIKAGCELAFPPIVASGTSAAEPHHTPQNRKISKGFCVIDFGVKHKGFCSDTTRTIYIGAPSEKDKKLYKMMHDLQVSVAESIRPGQKCSDPYDLTIKILGKYSKDFTHGLGHGVGVEIHELPNLKSKSKERFKRGMVFTVEPGIYLKNRLGIRIEDTILLDKKPVILTRISKKLMVV
ncbi:MAG: Xaa-Pro peptidase family protein [Nanoarchaeota archaeon]|nr:Xaa-Pro peptidase family protein [Nanoarchaeota archaeon]